MDRSNHRINLVFNLKNKLSHDERHGNRDEKTFVKILGKFYPSMVSSY